MNLKNQMIIVFLLFSLLGFFIPTVIPAQDTDAIIEISDKTVVTYWQKYENYSSLFFYEPGFYHDAPIPDGYTYENLAYIVNATMRNAGTDTIESVHLQAIFYDDGENILFGSDTYQYEVKPGETRDIYFHVSYYLRENVFFNATHVKIDVVDPFLQTIELSDAIAVWDFNEAGGSILYDVSGNGHNGIITGTNVVQGVSGNARSFNGVNEYIEIENSPDFNNLDQLSISCWFYIESMDVWEPVLNKGGFNEYQTDVFEVNVNSDGFIHFVLNFKNAGRQGFNSPSNQIVPHIWYHFIGTYDGDRVKIFLNGEQVSDYDAPNEQLTESNATLQIGLEYDSPPESYFHGLIDEISIYSKALQPSEVQQLFNLKTSYGIADSRKDNHAAERSILHGIFDDPAIPIVATVTSIIIVYLWNFFGNSIVEFLSDYTSEKIIDRKQKGIQKAKRVIPFISLTVQELLSMILAVTIFSIVLSWTWSTTLEEFLNLFLINLLAVGCIFIVRDVYRLSYSKRNNFKTEHVFWPFGALLTLGSTLLGNTFSLASYILAEDENKQYGLMLFHLGVLNLGIAIVSFLLNIVVPSVLLQMIFVFSIMSLIIDLVPVPPMDGYIIKKWSVKYWLALFSVATIMYIFMGFNLY